MGNAVSEGPHPNHCNQNLQTVKNSLNKVNKDRDCNRTSRVIITNNSGFPLHLKNQGDSSGYFLTDVKWAFANGDRELFNGYHGGINHSKKSDSACGSVGYVSVSIQLPGRTHTLCFGFDTHYSGRNHAGIQIRSSSGVTDGNGDVKGHGVDATGAVTDIDQLCDTEFTGSGDCIFEETSPYFKIRCTFTNDNQAEYHFVVTATQKAKDEFPNA
jgi:hypothetical protein